MCFKHVFARAHWPLNTGGELLNSSPLHPSQFSLASPWNRRVPGLSDLNHNYLPSSDGGESVHFVISISPLDMKSAPRHQKREHYVGLIDSTGEAEFETGLKSSLSCFLLLFLSPPSVFWSPSLPLFSHLYISPRSSLFLSPFIPSLSPCVSLPYRSRLQSEMHPMCLCQQNRLFAVKLSFIRIREILLQCHRVTGREIEQLHIPF